MRLSRRVAWPPRGTSFGVFVVIVIGCRLIVSSPRTLHHGVGGRHRHCRCCCGCGCCCRSACCSSRRSPRLVRRAGSVGLPERQCRFRCHQPWRIGTWHHRDTAACRASVCSASRQLRSTPSTRVLYDLLKLRNWLLESCSCSRRLQVVQQHDRSTQQAGGLPVGWLARCCIRLTAACRTRTRERRRASA